MAEREVRQSAWKKLALVVLVPSTAAGLACFPFLLILSFVPILSFFSLPSFLSLSLFLLYSFPCILYLLLTNQPPPLSPFKNFKLLTQLTLFIREFITCRIGTLMLKASLERLVSARSSTQNPTKPRVVQESIPYRNAPNRKLDVYYPSLSASSPDELAPVLLLLVGANWRKWFTKTLATKVALRLRRLGYCVVVPELSKIPMGCEEMVSDLRYALEWTEENVRTFGGDKEDIHLFGYGSGAHIALLTVVQDAVVRSRDSHLQRHSPKTSTEPPPSISSGIKRCRISSPEARLPPIKGMVLVSGVYDLVKQSRFERGRGVDEISALGGVGGGEGTVMSCPAHLLYGAKTLVDPSLLPSKFLIIAGGKDHFVPHLQSVLLKSLLIGVGMGVEDVKLKLYRDESHLGSLASLLTTTSTAASLSSLRPKSPKDETQASNAALQASIEAAYKQRNLLFWYQSRILTLHAASLLQSSDIACTAVEEWLKKAILQQPISTTQWHQLWILEMNRALHRSARNKHGVLNEMFGRRGCFDNGSEGAVLGWYQVLEVIIFSGKEVGLMKVENNHTTASPAFDPTSNFGSLQLFLRHTKTSLQSRLETTSSIYSNTVLHTPHWSLQKAMANVTAAQRSEQKILKSYNFGHNWSNLGTERGRELAWEYGLMGMRAMANLKMALLQWEITLVAVDPTIEFGRRFYVEDTFPIRSGRRVDMQKHSLAEYYGMSARGEGSSREPLEVEEERMESRRKVYEVVARRRYRKGLVRVFK